ncbi:hypothetical protein DSM112329_05105 [Paraconexibacter sp. AEG42_29]|uniref:Phosphatidate cytidylyltransferase n=1 Tax=Paraconexibacter sp. AEG42_29 TaxID=2997339 RepID=A0AAU7B3G5_9ACTN
MSTGAPSTTLRPLHVAGGLALGAGVVLWLGADLLCVAVFLALLVGMVALTTLLL